MGKQCFMCGSDLAQVLGCVLQVGFSLGVQLVMS